MAIRAIAGAGASVAPRSTGAESSASVTLAAGPLPDIEAVANGMAIAIWLAMPAGGRTLPVSGGVLPVAAGAASGVDCAVTVKNCAIEGVTNCAAKPAATGFAASSEDRRVAITTLDETASGGTIVAETGAFELASKALNDTALLLPEPALAVPEPSTDTAGLPIPPAIASRAALGAGDRRAGVAIIGKSSSGKVRNVLIKIRARLCFGAGAT